MKRYLLLIVAVAASLLAVPAVARGHETATPSSTASPNASAPASSTQSSTTAAAAGASSPLPQPSLIAAPVATSSADVESNAPSILRPESPGAVDIRRLTVQIIAILSGVAIVVWTVLTIAIIRGRGRRDSEVRQTHGNTTIEIIWTAIPAVIIAVLFTLTIRTIGELAIPASTQVHYAAVGHQWWWEFEFSGGIFKTANEIYLPVEQTVSADLVSTDVIHSYWVPQLGGKVDMIPGHVNRIAFIPSTTGRYLGECSEFCGHQHANMRFLVFVVSSADFSRWFANQQLPARQPTGAQAKAGGQFITTVACGGCHTIRGTSLAGVKGPDLTHFGSRTTLASVTLPNTPENLDRWITDPATVKPETLMPRIAMPPDRVAEIVAYLEELQ